MSTCNCSGCPHAANCRCVCKECPPLVSVKTPAAYYRHTYGWDVGEPPESLLVAEGPVAERFDQPTYVEKTNE